jgi:hypothetical protein
MNRGLKNTLIGCAVACAVLLMTGVASCVGFVLWLNRPGPLLQPESLMGADTTGFVEWTVRREDAGARRLLERLMQRVQQPHGRSPLPPWIQNIQNANRHRQVQGLLPVAAAWTIRPGADPDEDLHTLTLSVPRLGKRLVILDVILDYTLARSQDVRTETHRGARIYTLSLQPESRITFFFRGSDVFLVTDVETAKVAIDRLLEERAGSPASEAETGLSSFYTRTPPSGALRGAIVNAHGEIPRVLRILSDETSETEVHERWSALEALTVSGGFEGETAFSGSLELLGPDEAWARTHAEALASDAGAFLERLQIQAKVEPALDGRWVRVGIRIDDPAAQLEGLLDSLSTGPREEEQQEDE